MTYFAMFDNQTTADAQLQESETDAFVRAFKDKLQNGPEFSDSGWEFTDVKKNWDWNADKKYWWDEEPEGELEALPVVDAAIERLDQPHEGGGVRLERAEGDAAERRLHARDDRHLGVTPLCALQQLPVLAVAHLEGIAAAGDDGARLVRDARGGGRDEEREGDDEEHC